MEETVTIMVSSGPAAPPAPVEIPRRVGTVRIGALLGEGAGGCVLSGYDEALGRRVAVKVLHGGGAPHAVNEIVQGIRSAASIKHPNVVTVYSVEQVRGLAVIVMELIDGLSLRDVLKRTGPLDLSLALYVLSTTAQGVDALHRANVVHRDLKPANILFDREGDAHVCDFGLACAFDAGAFRSGATTIGGSPLYMAPEMFDGHVSFQSDVYAMGVLLFEALCGQAPYCGATISEVRALHAGGELPLQRLRPRALPEALVEIIERALHKQRILRFKSAGHLLRALAEIPSAPAEVMRARVADIVTAAQQIPRAADAASPGPTVAHTTFDLIAQRAAEKRRAKSGDGA
ncbi:MAG: serine/threonine protein kinase [Phycisphaerae bacterium]|nr:serine/threonine protein kinase [Phycisphaerae bacterium]MCZ2398563.1 serine/threonine protein kinase [Phycisphaerae bacterium]NUQ48586.1 serine/threonine protein kinase [Phycisphaerae bacterium]